MSATIFLLPVAPRVTDDMRARMFAEPIIATMRAHDLCDGPPRTRPVLATGCKRCGDDKRVTFDRLTEIEQQRVGFGCSFPCPVCVGLPAPQRGA